jgi:hypothetical protein
VGGAESALGRVKVISGKVMQAVNYSNLVGVDY